MAAGDGDQQPEAGQPQQAAAPAVSNPEASSGQASTTRPKTAWDQLGDDIWARFCLPWKHPTFITYFAIGVVGFGCLGIWLELLSEHSSAALKRTALLATMAAILGPSCLQFVLAEAVKYRRAFGMLIAAVVFATTLLTEKLTKDPTAIAIYVVLIFVALFMWWIANANQADFLDSKPDAPTGGSTDKAPEGSLAGFKFQ